MITNPVNMDIYDICLFIWRQNILFFPYLKSTINPIKLFSQNSVSIQSPWKQLIGTALFIMLDHAILHIYQVNNFIELCLNLKSDNMNTLVCTTYITQNKSTRFLRSWNYNLMSASGWKCSMTLQTPFLKNIYVDKIPPLHNKDLKG